MSPADTLDWNDQQHDAIVARESVAYIRYALENRADAHRAVEVGAVERYSSTVTLNAGGV